MLAVFLSEWRECGAQIEARHRKVVNEEAASSDDRVERVKGYDKLIANFGLKQFVIEGAATSEQFRQDYLCESEFESDSETDLRREPKIHSLARLASSFRTHINETMDSQRPNLKDFRITDEQLAASFAGTAPIDGVESLQFFSGKWFGRWADFEVDHHWSNVVEPKPAWRFRVPSENGIAEDAHDRFNGLVVEAFQYAWIGDGYGVNIVASRKTNQSSQRFLLGYVEHIKDGDFSQVTARRPHVGVDAGAGKLIWITGREVFFEQATETDGKANAYSITGFNYSVSSKR